MRKIIYVLFAIVISIAFHNDVMAQGVHIWKGGIRMTIYTNDVDSLVFFDKNGENQSTQTPGDEDLEILPPTPDTLMKPILFDAYEGGSTTRAMSVNSDSSLKETGFGVFGYELGDKDFREYDYYNIPHPNLMQNNHVSYNPVEGWTYSSLKYWGSSPQKYAFFAYAPYGAHYLYDLSDSHSSSAVKGFDFSYSGPTIQYQIPEDANDDVDLRWGQGVNEATAPVNHSTFYGEKVKFNFKHALSKVRVHVKLIENGGWANDKSTVQNVEIVGNIPNVASLSLYDGTWNVTGYTEKVKLLTEEKSVNTSAYTNAISAEGGCRYLIPGDGYEIQMGLEGNVYRIKLPGALETGKMYDFYVDVSKTSVRFNSTIADWANDGNADSVISTR